MTSIKELLKIRNEKKRKKPTFIRQDTSKHTNLEVKWRAPKGMHSKMRRKYKGKRRQPSLGFGSPRKVKGLTREGYKKVLVHNLLELNQIKETEIIELSKTIGSKKKLELLKKIKEKKLKVLNVKDVENKIKLIEADMEERKKKVEARKKKKEKPKETAKKEEKKEIISQEEKEKKEKEEKRKTLEKAR